MTGGLHRISVLSSWGRSNELDVTLDAASATTLECEQTLAAWAAIVWGVLCGAAAAVLLIANVSRFVQPPLPAGTTVFIVGLAVIAMVVCGWLAVQAWARGLEWTGNYALELRVPTGNAAGSLASTQGVKTPIMGIVYFGAALLGLFVAVALAPRAAGVGMLVCWMLGGAACGVYGSALLVTAAERFCGVRLAAPLGFAVYGALVGFLLLPVFVSGIVTARHLWIPAAGGLVGAAFGFFQQRRERRPPQPP